LQEFRSCRINEARREEQDLFVLEFSGAGEFMQRQTSSARLVPVVRHEGPAPKGQESIAQGLPWVSRINRSALKGLKRRTRSASKVPSRSSPYLPPRDAKHVLIFHWVPSPGENPSHPINLRNLCNLWLPVPNPS
jgi:hypothetical protein